MSGCSNCHEKRRAMFSKSQLSKGLLRRCKTCVASSVAPTDSVRSNLPAMQAGGLARTIRGLDRATDFTEQFDLAGYSKDRIDELVADAFTEPLAIQEPVQCKFWVGGGKQKRDRYDKRCGEYLTAALRKIGFKEDPTACVDPGCQGLFKTQHNTSTNRKIVMVFPKISAAGHEVTADTATAAAAAAAASIVSQLHAPVAVVAPGKTLQGPRHTNTTAEEVSGQLQYGVPRPNEMSFSSSFGAATEHNAQLLRLLAGAGPDDPAPASFPPPDDWLERHMRSEWVHDGDRRHHSYGKGLSKEWNYVVHETVPRLDSTSSLVPGLQIKRTSSKRKAAQWPAGLAEKVETYRKQHPESDLTKVAKSLDTKVALVRQIVREWERKQATQAVHESKLLIHAGMRLEDFLSAPQAKAAGLGRAEVIALRLYTGPGYAHVNCCAREGKQHFPVTSFALESAIIKLALSSEPGKLKSFRGIAGSMRMPAQFRKEYCEGKRLDRSAVIVERGFMSTTRNLDVVQRSFSGRTLFYICARSHRGGTLRGGADVAWASQYPEEAEVLFPQFTQLWAAPLAKRDPNEEKIFGELRQARFQEGRPPLDVYQFSLTARYDEVHKCPLVPGFGWAAAAAPPQ
eukprot:COSAG01_NODE_294_length_19294_cov_35.559312_8_plen_626_part_00